VSYLEEHRETLRQLFDALGRADDWTSDDDALVRYMEQRWLGVEHGPGSGKDAFDDDALERAWPLLQQLGVVDRVSPTETEYDHVVVMGASGIGMHRRLELVRLSGITARRVSVLVGLRPHSGLDRDGGLGELLAADGRFAAAPGWTAPAGLLRSQGLLGANVDPLVAAQVVLPSETDLARLLLLKQWPGLELVEVRTGGSPGVTNELGRRTVLLETYRESQSQTDYLLLNGASVDRSDAETNRPARPTSVSTITEWASVCLDPADRTVLVVVNQPHLTRVRRSVEATLVDLGRTGLAIEVAGCEVLRTSAQLPLILGELPARINDRR
jgi:hypothetical protein